MSHEELRASRGYRFSTLGNPGTRLFVQGNLVLFNWKLLPVRLVFIAFWVSSTIGPLDKPGFKFRLWPTGVNGDILQNRIYSIGSLGRLNVKHLLGA